MTAHQPAPQHPWSTSKSQDLDPRIRIRAPLRCDGIGRLDCAEDTESGGRLAVRWLPLDANGDAAARACSKLPVHPTLPRILQTGQVGGSAFVAMDFPEGKLLSTLVGGGERLESELVIRVGAQIAEALTVMHAQDVVHGELSPESVLVVPAARAYLWDMPLVIANRMTDRRGEQRLMQNLVKTAPYLAPERTRGDIPTRESDVYALGVVLCVSAGAPLPSAHTTLGVVHQISTGEWAPRVPSMLPDPWRSMVMRMLATDPASRPTAREVAQLFASLPVTAAPPTVPEFPAVQVSAAAVAEAMKAAADAMPESAPVAAPVAAIAVPLVAEAVVTPAPIQLAELAPQPNPTAPLPMQAFVSEQQPAPAPVMPGSEASSVSASSAPAMHGAESDSVTEGVSVEPARVTIEIPASKNEPVRISAADVVALESSPVMQAVVQYESPAERPAEAKVASVMVDGQHDFQSTPVADSTVGLSDTDAEFLFMSSRVVQKRSPKMIYAGAGAAVVLFAVIAMLLRSPAPEPVPSDAPVKEATVAPVAKAAEPAAPAAKETEVAAPEAPPAPEPVKAEAAAENVEQPAAAALTAAPARETAPPAEVTAPAAALAATKAKAEAAAAAAAAAKKADDEEPLARLPMPGMVVPAQAPVTKRANAKRAPAPHPARVAPVAAPASIVPAAVIAPVVVTPPVEKADPPEPASELKRPSF